MKKVLYPVTSLLTGFFVLSLAAALPRAATAGGMKTYRNSARAAASRHKHHGFKAHSQILIRPLDTVNFSDGINYDTTLKFSTGIGSGAFHYPGDDRNTVYTISDRGVNVKCDDDVDIIGADICADGKIFPIANYSPSIFKLQRHGHHGWKITEVIRLKDATGKQISGLPNPLTSMTTETAYDKQGNTIGLDANGLDTEALLRLSDGTFWVSEEYAPSLVHVSAAGEVLERLVPVGVAGELNGANYPVVGVLPAILSKRKLNRGIESIAVSPDERYIYFIMQSPLANPNKKTYKKSRNVRLFKMDRQNEEIIGEYVYVIDTPETFLADSTSKQSKVKVSEMVAYGNDKLIVLERINKTTKLYRINLDGATNILYSEWDDTVTSPSLEQVTDLASVAIAPIAKEIALDSAVDLPPDALPSKVEGVAILDKHELFLINDNDFGIEGANTRLVDLKIGRRFFK
ncbi:hypothetical protein BMS3Bbin14_00339 [bacterium BMS3Bbin14]|nr:hypothetical protein BMS3Abin13_00716 [bacterium BMS3Abin13]GBE51882.1 hypothetical protein BMS3Bbin14_00339 [bacterium BMS3Bbin14]HDO29813.1 esterase-like activity of phytase family protein [Desulfobacteraceae bacterium]